MNHQKKIYVSISKIVSEIDGLGSKSPPPSRSDKIRIGAQSLSVKEEYIPNSEK